jgi:hypothetical protein
MSRIVHGEFGRAWPENALPFKSLPFARIGRFGSVIVTHAQGFGKPPRMGRRGVAATERKTRILPKIEVRDKLSLLD